MKLTLQLCNYRNRIWLVKQLWKGRGFIKETPLFIPQVVRTRGLEIVDPNVEKPVDTSWVPPVPDDPRFANPPKPEDHPDFHVDPVYSFNADCKLMEGLKQACILTKTQSFEGLPSSISERIGKVEIKDQDELIQRYIMQANVWNPTKTKLRKRYSTLLPGWKYKTEFGIPKWKIRNILLSNMLRLLNSLSGEYPELLDSRRHSHYHSLSAMYKFRGDKTIRICGDVEWMVSSNVSPPPLATSDLVQSSIDHELPDIYPVAPTMDIEKNHIWRSENVTGWHKEFSHKQPCIIIHNAGDGWKNEECNARDLMFCFGHSLALAKDLYGEDVKTLPEPISVLSVSAATTKFNFSCFQLNTMDLTSTDGIKNLFWFDNDNHLFNKVIPKRAMLRNTLYEDYEPTVFNKLLAMYSYGLGMQGKS